MFMYAIHKAMIKKGIAEKTILFYLQTLKRFPQNQWVLPNNADADGKSYDVFDALYRENLICKCIIPQFNQTNGVGVKHYYMWSEDLQYNAYFVI